MFKELLDKIAKMPKRKCSCGTIGKFEQVATGYNQFDERGNPIVEDIVMCKNCETVYTETEYKALPKVASNGG